MIGGLTPAVRRICVKYSVRDVEAFLVKKLGLTST
jgi:hypothetical protein